MLDLFSRALGFTLLNIATGTALSAEDSLRVFMETFNVCHHQGCADSTKLQLTAEDAQLIASAFGSPATTAEQERSAIARAIGQIEQLVGARTGTDKDIGGTFSGAFRDGQMDCIDEARNTTTYLNLLARSGMMRWHRILTPSTRLPIPRGWWPHTSAVIREHATGTEYVVDSWFDDNGKPPHIVELKTWERGWKPGAEVSAQ